MKQMKTLVSVLMSLCALVGCSGATEPEQTSEPVVVAPETQQVEPQSGGCNGGTDCIKVDGHRYCRKLVKQADGSCG
jgi:PBP1b-binding outer membrane lipoprotein LpoB